MMFFYYLGARSSKTKATVFIIRAWTLGGSHKLEKYLNLESFFEKYLKIKSA